MPHDLSQGAAPPDAASAPDLADVLVPRRVATPFTYRIPLNLRTKVKLGSRVQVPLGAAAAEGIVVAFPSVPPLSSRRRTHVALRDIQAINPAPMDYLPADLLALTRWLAARYVAPLGQCLRLVLPVPPPPRGRAAMALRGDTAPEAAPVGSSSSKSAAVPPEWTSLNAAILTPRHATFLVLGCSPSRHQLMLQAAALVLERKRTVLIVAPEVDRAVALADAAQKEWGTAVGLWHGGLSSSARNQLWHQCQVGIINVIVGTRSAVFLPLPALGLVCVDAEDDFSLKEEQEPRYHAREVAAWRAQQHGAPVLLGSAHPSLDTMARTDVTRLEFGQPDSVTHRSPHITTVDIRERPYGVIMSEAMLCGIRSSLEAKSRAVLFLNRKGFAPALHCRACGQAPQCTNCTVTLTYYRRARHLACHYCGAAYPVPVACPACGGILLQPSGFGTEQLEDEVRTRFPGIRIARLDTDSTPKLEEAEKIRHAMARGEIDVLIGTQLLFQGSSLPLVGFVGIPYADAGLHRPDFRASERTYASLLDAVGLARPAVEGGTVVMQTYLPTHHVIEAITTCDPARFYEPELACRQALAYPPFTHVIHLGVSGAAETAVRKAAHKWSEMLAREAARDPSLAASLMILGPVAAPVARRRGRHRWQILVKSDKADAAREAVAASWQALESKLGRTVKLEVDVDPVELS